jgi:hypothetical protein
MRRTLAELGVNPASIDPRRILAAIAGDADAPASARVAACKVLLAVVSERSEDSVAGGDAVSLRAQELLAARRRAN